MNKVIKSYRNNPRLKRSIIWKLSKDELSDIVKNSTSFCEILKKINVAPVGGNVNTLKRRLNEEKIDFSHIPLGIKSNLGRKFDVEILTYDDLFVENCEHSRHALKRYIIKNNLIPYKCDICGNEGVWNNKPLVLILDHINGIRNDNRIENLRFLCPNCNAQQETFAGKNRKSYGV